MITSKVEWWNTNRIKYNKALLITGIIVILLPALLFFLISNLTKERLSVLILGPFFYAVYMGTVNFIFLLLELADRQFIKSVDNTVKDKLFNYFFWNF